MTIVAEGRPLERQIMKVSEWAAGYGVGSTRLSVRA